MLHQVQNEISHSAAHTPGSNSVCDRTQLQSASSEGHDNAKVQPRDD